MVDSPHELATVVTFDYNKEAIVSCHTGMLGHDRIRLKKS